MVGDLVGVGGLCGVCRVIGIAKTVLQWVSLSFAVKLSDCSDLDLYLRFMAFQNCLGCFFAILQIVYPSLIVWFCFAFRFIRLYFVRTDANLCLLTVCLCLKK